MGFSKLDGCFVVEDFIAVRTPAWEEEEAERKAGLVAGIDVYGAS